MRRMRRLVTSNNNNNVNNNNNNNNKTSVSETIRKAPLAEAQTALGKHRSSAVAERPCDASCH